MSDLFKKITDSLGVAGESINDAANSFVEGAIETGKSGLKIFDELVLGGDGKVFDLLQIFSIRYTLAKSFYPTDDIERNLSQTPDDEKLLVDLFDMQERQFSFSMKLIRLLNLTPFSAEMSSKSASIIEQEREIGKARDFRNREISLILDSVSKKIDRALIGNDTDSLRAFVPILLKCKILQRDESTFEQWLETTKDLICSSEWSHLAGRYYLMLKKYDDALVYLRKAYGEKATFSEDDLSECLDQAIAASDSDKKAEFEKIRNEIFPYIAGSEMLSRFKGIPISFLLIKKSELIKIMNWGSDDKSI